MNKLNEREIIKIFQRKLGNKKLVNMVTLGYIMKLVGIDLKLINLEKSLPKKLLQENLKAIEQGYVYEERSDL